MRGGVTKGRKTMKRKMYRARGGVPFSRIVGEVVGGVVWAVVWLGLAFGLAFM